MTPTENTSGNAAEEFVLLLENFDKLELLEIESAVAEADPQLHVVDEDEQRFGEPGTLMMIALVGTVALPPVLVWLASHRYGFRIEEKHELTLPDGSKAKSSVKISLSKSAPPSAEQLSALSKFRGVDPAKFEASYRSDKPKGEAEK